MASKRGKASLSRTLKSSASLTLVSVLCRQKDGYDEVETELVDRLTRASREEGGERSKTSSVHDVVLEGSGQASVQKVAIQGEYVAFLTDDGRVGRVRFALSKPSIDQKRVAGESVNRIQEVGDEVFARRLQDQFNREAAVGISSGVSRWSFLSPSYRLADGDDDDDLTWMDDHELDLSPSASYSEDQDSSSSYYDSAPLLGSNSVLESTVPGLALPLQSDARASSSRSRSGNGVQGRDGDSSRKLSEVEEEWPQPGEVEWLKGAKVRLCTVIQVPGGY